MVVVGGTGFIGHHVTRWLATAGADVTALHRARTPVRAPGVRDVRADRTDPAALAAALAAAEPEVVVDMTAYTGGDVQSLLAALPASSGRLVVISSGDVYWAYGAFLGLTSPRPVAAPMDERAPLRDRLYPYRDRAGGPDDLLYRYEKIEVERRAASAAVPVTILRLPMVYGPGDPQRRVSGYLERMETATGTVRINAAEAAWRCTRGYVEDVAWAIALAALDDRASGETLNLGEREALTELAWAREIAAAAGWQGQVTDDPATPPSMPAAWRVNLEVDTGRLRALLGYREPVGRSEGLRRTAPWRGSAAERITP